MARHEFTQRRRALDIIFEAEQKDILVPGLLRELLAERRTISTHQVPIQDLGASYVNLVATHLYDVDGMIEDYSKWGLRRLASLDRAVLRLGIAEICFAGTPISEAVIDYSDMVRELGNEKSIGFITAIFNRAKKECETPTNGETSEDSGVSAASDDATDIADSVVVDEPGLIEESVALDRASHERLEARTDEEVFTSDETGTGQS